MASNSSSTISISDIKDNSGIMAGTIQSGSLINQPKIYVGEINIHMGKSKSEPTIRTHTDTATELQLNSTQANVQPMSDSDLYAEMQKISHALKEIYKSGSSKPFYSVNYTFDVARTWVRLTQKLSLKTDSNEKSQLETYSSADEIEDHGELLNQAFGLKKWARFLLVEGKPGSGKTSLMHRIAYDWACASEDDKNYSLYHLVLIVQFRQLQSYSYGSIFDLVLDGLKLVLGDDSCRRLKTVLDFVNNEEQEKFKLLILLDGLDEWDTKRCMELHNWLNEKNMLKKLPKFWMVVSSRPSHAFAELRGLKRRFTHAKLIGFSSLEQREDFIKLHVKPKTEQDEIIESLKVNENLAELVINPFYLTIFCLVHSKLQKKTIKEKEKKTIAELYHAISWWLLNAYQMKDETLDVPVHFGWKWNESNSVADSWPIERKLFCINEQWTDFPVIQNLGKFAFSMLMRPKVSTPNRNRFSYLELQNGNINSEIVVAAGFLHKHSDSHFSFPHKSVQDYLAIYYCLNWAPVTEKCWKYVPCVFIGGKSKIRAMHIFVWLIAVGNYKGCKDDRIHPYLSPTKKIDLSEYDKDPIWREIVASRAFPKVLKLCSELEGLIFGFSRNHGVVTYSFMFDQTQLSSLEFRNVHFDVKYETPIELSAKIISLKLVNCSFTKNCFKSFVQQCRSSPSLKTIEIISSCKEYLFGTRTISDVQNKSFLYYSADDGGCVQIVNATLVENIGERELKDIISMLPSLKTLRFIKLSGMDVPCMKLLLMYPIRIIYFMECVFVQIFLVIEAALDHSRAAHLRCVFEHPRISSGENSADLKYLAKMIIVSSHIELDLDGKNLEEKERTTECSTTASSLFYFNLSTIFVFKNGNEYVELLTVRNPYGSGAVGIEQISSLLTKYPNVKCIEFCNSNLLASVLCPSEDFGVGHNFLLNSCEGEIASVKFGVKISWKDSSIFSDRKNDAVTVDVNDCGSLVQLVNMCRSIKELKLFNCTNPGAILCQLGDNDNIHQLTLEAMNQHVTPANCDQLFPRRRSLMCITYDNCNFENCNDGQLILNVLFPYNINELKFKICRFSKKSWQIIVQEAKKLNDLSRFSIWLTFEFLMKNNASDFLLEMIEFHSVHRLALEIRIQDKNENPNEGKIPEFCDTIGKIIKNLPQNGTLLLEKRWLQGQNFNKYVKQIQSTPVEGGSIRIEHRLTSKTEIVFVRQSLNHEK